MLCVVLRVERHSVSLTGCSVLGATILTRTDDTLSPDVQGTEQTTFPVSLVTCCLPHTISAPRAHYYSSSYVSPGDTEPESSVAYRLLWSTVIPVILHNALSTTARLPFCLSRVEEQPNVIVTVIPPGHHFSHITVN